MQKIKDLFNTIWEWVKVNPFTVVFLLLAVLIVILLVVLLKRSKQKSASKPLKNKPKKARSLIAVLLLGLALLSSQFAFADSNNVTGLTDLGNGLYKVETTNGEFPQGTLGIGELSTLEWQTITSDTSNHEIKIYWIEGSYRYDFDIDDLAFGPSHQIRAITFYTTYDYLVSIGDDAHYVLYDQLDQYGTLYIKYGTDNTRPAIDGNEHFASNVDNPTPVANFIREISAIDDIDGDISHNIVLEKDNYTPNNKTLGRYDVDLSVTDQAGNKSTFKFWVTVADVTAPTATADLTKKIISYDKTYDLNTFKNTIVISDNYYSKSDLTIEITRDTYTANKTKLGTYYVDFTIKDPSNNETVLTVTIEVKDLVKPIINGVQTIIKSYTNILTTTEILAGITANDAIDGNLTSEIKIESDTYTGNGTKPGNYAVVISVTDNAGNKETKEIKITVIDDKSAQWYITNNVTINLPANTEMTRQQVLDLLALSNLVTMSPRSIVTYSMDTYSANIGTPGIYTLAFSVKEPNANESEYTFAVNVMGDNINDDVDIIEDVTLFDNVVAFAKDWWLVIVLSAGLVFIGAKVLKAVKKVHRKSKGKGSK